VSPRLRIWDFGSDLMAGRGPAPKHQSQRRRTNEPVRGEWVDLPLLERSVLPDLPAGEWSERTVSAWAAWRCDPATVMYGPAEIQLCVDLAYVYEQWVQDGTAALAAELRQRQDGLGLSPKGKQDRHWRVTPVEGAEAPKRKLAEVRRLRAVDPAG
jgi:hypothetical protein